jgi:FkbM family methyltransferase
MRVNRLMGNIIKNSDLVIAKKLRRLRPAFLASFLKKILLPTRLEHRCDYGVFYIDIASDFGLILASDREYEPYMRQTLEHYLSKDSVFVDLGANEGYFTVLASKLVGQKGKVHCIEPQSRLQPIIKKNIDLNSCKNVIVEQLAISDNIGEANIYITPDINTGCSGMTRVSKYPVPTEKINTTTLQQYFLEKKIYI